MDYQAAYRQLAGLNREVSLLESCAALLRWDEQTYLPPAGTDHRADQLALLAGLHHQRATDARIGGLLDELEISELVADPESVEAVNIRAWARSYRRRQRLPQSLVEEIARTTCVAYRAWERARGHSDYGSFQPWLDKILALKCREADLIGYLDHPYDALLDEYEPGATTRKISILFEELRRELVPLVAALCYSSRRPDVAILQKEFPKESLRGFGEEVARRLGFDFQAGRIDTTTHPFFEPIGPGDCRLTARFDPRNFNDSFFGILHEVGHGLYEQGLDPAYAGTPMGESVSMGLHESQSRLWENAVGRNQFFWRFFFPCARHWFPDALHDVTEDAFFFAVNNVEATAIRVGADEATYNLHVLIRFDLERTLLSGDLSASELPGAWNEKYQHYLGVRPANACQGCLQDSHWSEGLFGYFPTYTLGNLYAAQLFSQASKELSGLESSFKVGDFHPLLDWLRERIYSQGHRYLPEQLMIKVTGRALDQRPLIEMLKSKLGRIYGLD
jgi:carboxypeptidase Taq